MKKMKFKRVMSLFLVMILTMSQFMNVRAEAKADGQTEGTWTPTEYITNGDFETYDNSEGWENYASEWTVAFGDGGNRTYTVKSDENAKNNNTKYFNYYNGSEEIAFSMTRTIVGVPSGTYRLSFEQEGEVASSGLSISVAGLSPMELPDTAGWDSWAGIITDPFILSETSDVTITISGTVPNGYWGDFDNFVLEQFVVAEEELKLEVRDPEFTGSLWDDKIWSVIPNASWENAEFKYFSYTDDNYLVVGENQGTTAFKFWSQNAQEVTFLQQVNIPAGTYQVTSDFMGEKGNIQVVFDNQYGDLAALNGYNTWVETNDTFTVTEDIKDTTIGFKITLEAGGYGYIDSINVTEVAGEEDGKPADSNVFTVNDDNYTLTVTVGDVTPEAGDTIKMSAKVTAADGREVTDLRAADLNLWWWTDVWMSGHEDGLNDVSYTKDDTGYALSASAMLPSVGTYYIVAELEYNGIKLPVVVPITTTKPETDTPITGEINVEKIKNLPEDFIMGMDISSVMSEFASGVTYKDFEGNTIDNITDFCKFLAKNGITHIRVRVWNDPYDATGNGYGGGNNDVAKAAEIAKGCREAGLKMLIDFHCSDLWADPGKQQAPKAWTDYTLGQKEEAVGMFIGNALSEIDRYKDTVAMVQVGNETTGAFVGENSVENMCKLFNSGAKAIRDYNKDVKVVIHVTNPEKGRVTTWAENLNTYAVDYDVLATSYYPYWHGTLANLQSELTKVKTTYGKDAMVAETSYAYTLEDTDGHANTVRVGNNDAGTDTLQPFTVQGQATAIRNVIETVNNAGGLGVFYWEPAWITVGDTTGKRGDELKAQIEANKEKWETYGSGWASSYGGEYDPEDAGKWYGGSAVDNEAMFYPDGTPTAGLYVWNYVKTGAVSKYVSVESIEDPEETIFAHTEFTLPETVVVTYNSGEVAETVKWNQKEAEAIDTAVAGTYTVSGTVTFSKEVNQGSYSAQETAEVVYTLTVKQPNLIDINDAGFENGGNYIIGGNGISEIPAKDDPYEGTGSMHWYNTSETTGTVTYNKSIRLEPGKYSTEIMSQGYAKDTVSLQILSAEADEVLFEGEAAVLEGWAVWKTASVKFEVKEQTDVKIRIVVNMQAGGWGTADALYLYKAGELEAKDTTVVKRVENEDGTQSFELTNKAAEGISIKGSNNVLATAKFDAGFLKEDSDSFKNMIDQVKKVSFVVKDDTKLAFLEVNLWDKTGAQLHENFGKVSVTVALPDALKNVKEVEVFRVELDQLIPCGATIADGKIVIVTDHFSTFLIKEKTIQNQNVNTGNATDNRDTEQKDTTSATTVTDNKESATLVQTIIASKVVSEKKTESIKETIENFEETKENLEEPEGNQKAEVTASESAKEVIPETETSSQIKTGGSIPVWEVVLVIIVICAFVGIYVFVKQKKSMN